MAEATAVSQGCDLFLSVGTSALVYPTAALPYEALDHGAVVVEINPLPTPLTSSIHHALIGPAGQILPALLEQSWS